MEKIIKYPSLFERDLAERALEEVLRRVVAILEAQHMGFYEEGVNKLFPTADGEPYALSYKKPN